MWNPECMKIVDSLIDCNNGRVLVLDAFNESTMQLLNCLESKGYSAMWLDYHAPILTKEDLFYSFGLATREYWNFNLNIEVVGNFLSSNMTIPQNGCLLYYGNAAPIKEKFPELFDAMIDIIKRESRIWQSKGVFFGALIVLGENQE